MRRRQPYWTPWKAFFATVTVCMAAYGFAGLMANAIDRTWEPEVVEVRPVIEPAPWGRLQVVQEPAPLVVPATTPDPVVEMEPVEVLVVRPPRQRARRAAPEVEWKNGAPIIE